MNEIREGKAVSFDEAFSNSWNSWSTVPKSKPRTIEKRLVMNETKAGKAVHFDENRQEKNIPEIESLFDEFENALNCLESIESLLCSMKSRVFGPCVAGVQDDGRKDPVPSGHISMFRHKLDRLRCIASNIGDNVRELSLAL